MAIEKFDDLTKTQQGLISELVKEFTKINPKPTKGDKRFTVDTINECLKEEQRFNDTMTKHNLTMMKVFIGQFKNDIKEFKKEFGKVIDIKLRYSYSSALCETPEQLMERNMEATKIDLIEAKETILFFVSKTMPHSGDSRSYYEVYVDFKREQVSTTLESGKVVTAYKVIGLQYNTRNWLHRKDAANQSFSTLDELIQRHQPTQQNLAKLV